MEAFSCKRRQSAAQPSSEILAEATRVDEMRLYFPVVEKVRLDCYVVVHLNIVNACGFKRVS